MSDEQPVQTAVDRMGEAQTPSELIAAHRVARRAITRQRAALKLGPLAQAYREAMEIWDTEKAAGHSLEERQATLERILRAAWPQVRPWHFICDRCQDSGWEHRTCTEAARCGRPFKLPGQRGDDYTGRGQCGDEHSYVVPCWCEKGRAFDRRLMNQQPARSAEDFVQAGKSKPTRIGR